MRVIAESRLREFSLIRGQADARTPLLEWLEDVKFSIWSTPADVKATFGNRVDFVRTRRTANTLAVFDIAGNKYRMISAIHYLDAHPEKGRVYVLRIMTHEEYDEDKWKDDL